ncbi:hypothetical protein D3C72_784590 [compost metagenome]
MVEAVEDLFGLQTEQLFILDGAGELDQVVEVGAVILAPGGQLLQQYAGSAGLALVVAGADPEPGGELLGLGEVLLEAGRQGVGLEGYDALIALALFRGDGDHQLAVAYQALQLVVGRQLPFIAGHAAQLLVVIAVDHRQTHRAVPLQLHSDGAFELEGGGQQAGGDQQFTQQFLHLYRVVLGIDDVAIGTIQLDQLPPHFVLFEQIAIQEILVTHHAFLGFSGGKDKYIVKQVVRN